MRNIDPDTGAICGYARFRSEARKPRRTQATQRREIDNSLEVLTAQGDFWSLDLIRKIATAMTDSNGAGMELYQLLREVVEAPAGAWIVRRKR